jgi:ubiquitin carboxyl-terminal hydrolase L5
MIFLFKFSKKNYKRDKPVAYAPSLFFANQVIPDACATQAILSILLNLKLIDIGEDLRNFKEFCNELGYPVKNK